MPRHLRQQARGVADLREQDDMPKPTCAASDCGDEAKIKGYCRKHHWRWKKYGDPAKLSRITALDTNPTTLPVAIAFTTPGIDPQTSDWQTASWNTSVTLGSNQYLAQCLVGPGGTIQLAIGTYQIWAKVTGATEIPQEPAGMLTIY